MSDEAVSKIEAALHEISERLRNIELDLAAIKPRLCPMPGACVGLTGRIDDHERRLTLLKEHQDKVVGGLMITRIMWVLVSTIIASVTSGTLAYYITHHK